MISVVSAIDRPTLRDTVLRNYIQAYIDHSEQKKSRFGLTWFDAHGPAGRARAEKLKCEFSEKFSDPSSLLIAQMIAFFQTALVTESGYRAHSLRTYCLLAVYELTNHSNAPRTLDDILAQTKTGFRRMLALDAIRDGWMG
jgi:hypothetical protein